MEYFNDLTGRVFGKLEVVGLAEGSVKNSKAHWKCRCECGKDIIRSTNTLISKSEYTKICWCNHSSIVKTHGKSKTREYRIWSQIKGRTSGRRNDLSSKCYRDRNITMCSRWFNSFENFFEDMGESNGLSIDRIDNNKGYFKENCRWATPLEQIHNRDCTIYLEYNGQEKTLMEWCILYNIKYDTAHKKYKYRNKSIKDIIENTKDRKTFLKDVKRRVTLYNINREPFISFLNTKDACDFLGFKKSCSIYNLIKSDKLIKNKYYGIMF